MALGRLSSCFVCAVLVAAVAAADTPAWTYPVHCPPWLLQNTVDPGLPELAGIDIVQGGRTISSEVPELTPGEPAQFRLHWIPRVPLRQPIQVRILIRGTGFAPSPAYWTECSLSAGQSGAGLPMIQPCTLSLPPRRFVGYGTLTIAMSYDADPVWDEAPVAYRGPCRVLPATWTPQSSRDRIAPLFPEQSVDLRTGFRLGSDTAITLPIPNDFEGGLGGVGLVSNVSWIETLGPGDLLGYVEALDAEGKVLARRPIRMGRETGLDRSITARRKGARVAWQDENGRGDAVYVYAGTATFEKLVTAQQLRLRYVAEEAMLDVITVVLIPAEPVP